jgi:hypothetical protein
MGVAGHLAEREVGCVSLAYGGAEARGARAASEEAHPSLEHGERVALQLDRAARTRALGSGASITAAAVASPTRAGGRPGLRLSRGADRERSAARRRSARLPWETGWSGLAVREWEEREQGSEIVFGDAARLVLSTVKERWVWRCAAAAVGHGSGGGSAGDVGRGGGGTRGGGAVAEAWRARWLAAARWRSAHGTCSGRERRESCGRVGDLGFWVKFDGIHVAHELNIRTWVPTFLIR